MAAAGHGWQEFAATDRAGGSATISYDFPALGRRAAAGCGPCRAILTLDTVGLAHPVRLSSRGGHGDVLPDTSSIQTSSRAKEWAVPLQCSAPRPNAPRLTELLQGSDDWSALLALADHHGVLTLLAERLKDLQTDAPPEIRETLHERQRRQTVFALSLTAEMFRLLEYFAGLGL